jgi:hypothetical protein
MEQKLIPGGGCQQNLGPPTYTNQPLLFLLPKKKKVL